MLRSAMIEPSPFLWTRVLLSPRHNSILFFFWYFFRIDCTSSSSTPTLSQPNSPAVVSIKKGANSTSRGRNVAATTCSSIDPESPYSAAVICQLSSSSGVGFHWRSASNPNLNNPPGIRANFAASNLKKATSPATELRHWTESNAKPEGRLEASRFAVDSRSPVDKLFQ